MNQDRSESPTSGEFTVAVSNPDDRRMLALMCRFYADPPRCHALHDLKRLVCKVGGKPHRQVHALTSFTPKLRRGKVGTVRWTIIVYDLDGEAIHFRPAADERLARAAFDLLA